MLGTEPCLIQRLGMFFFTRFISRGTLVIASFLGANTSEMVMIERLAGWLKPPRNVPASLRHLDTRVILILLILVVVSLLLRRFWSHFGYLKKRQPFITVRIPDPRVFWPAVCNCGPVCACCYTASTDCSKIAALYWLLDITN